MTAEDADIPEVERTVFDTQPRVRPADRRELSYHRATEPLAVLEGMVSKTS